MKDPREEEKEAIARHHQISIGCRDNYIYELTQKKTPTIRRIDDKVEVASKFRKR